MDAHQAPSSRRRPQAIYLLPNLFTTGGLFAGFYAIIASMDQQFVAACIAVFVAAFCDGVDGRIARLTNTQSAFGVQYDSLSDLISFGLAPSLIMYNWSLIHLRELSPMLGKIGWLVAFLYAACAALRLARFNTQIAVVDKRWFVGLASPAAAGTIVVAVWFAESSGYSGAELRAFTPWLTAVVALLMVSRVRYYSFKAWPERIPFYWLAILLLIVVALVAEPASTLLLIVGVYLLSGPVLTVWRKIKGEPSETALAHPDEDSAP
ncbi:MAG: CDP-diacylglycerol--serine O-phosphatidyltransferase [Xanthomonadales bacterium]|jgi:CDP-diacylglycerol--serine O-phosphatidyltransferase|nr:CDP-diacylglycerol--serine O-phosphatidyltransferase [Xanthomonadales bacterium]